MVQSNELDSICTVLDANGLLPIEALETVKKLDKSFEITGFMRRKTDGVSYKASILKNDNLGVFSLPGYETTLLRVGNIAHTNIPGLNTADLEQRLAAIEWGDVYPHTLRERQDIVHCILDLGKLLNTKDRKLNEIAEQLVLKYLACTPLEIEFNFGKSRQQYETSLLIDLNGNEKDINLNEAYHLLCGRGVAKPLFPDQKDDTLIWFQLEEGRLIEIKDFDLSGKLQGLPFANQRSVLQIAEDVVKLSGGKQLGGRFKIKGHAFSGYYEASPKDGDVVIRDINQNKLDLELLRKDSEQIKSLPKKEKSQNRKLGL